MGNISEILEEPKEGGREEIEENETKEERRKLRKIKRFEKEFYKYRVRHTERLLLQKTINPKILFNFNEEKDSFVTVDKVQYKEGTIDVYYFNLTVQYAKELHDLVVMNEKFWKDIYDIFTQCKNPNATFLMMSPIEYNEFILKIQKRTETMKRESDLAKTEIVIKIETEGQENSIEENNSSPGLRKLQNGDCVKEEEDSDSSDENEGESDEYDSSSGEDDEDGNEIFEKIEKNK